MNDQSWMNDPALKNIDPIKLQILSAMSKEASSKSSNEMLPFFLSAMNQANEKGVSFSSPERDLLLKILMQQLAPEERKKAETIIQMTSAFQKKNE